jgi:hypothetical protein
MFCLTAEAMDPTDPRLTFETMSQNKFFLQVTFSQVFVTVTKSSPNPNLTPYFFSEGNGLQIVSFSW